MWVFIHNVNTTLHIIGSLEQLIICSEGDICGNHWFRFTIKVWKYSALATAAVSLPKIPFICLKHCSFRWTFTIWITSELTNWWCILHIATKSWCHFPNNHQSEIDDSSYCPSGCILSYWYRLVYCFLLHLIDNSNKFSIIDDLLSNEFLSFGNQV